MPIKKDHVVYKSFEQFQAELFPKSTIEKKKSEKVKDTASLGVQLANDAVDQLLGISVAN